MIKENNMQLLTKQSENVFALMRIFAGALFAFHGTQKIFGWFASHETAIGSQLWFGGLIELVCGVLIVLGFQTRIAAFIASGTMAVAYIQFHWAFQFNEKFFPAVNGGDAAILYSFIFLYIACKGAGKLSLDKH